MGICERRYACEYPAFIYCSTACVCRQAQVDDDSQDDDDDDGRCSTRNDARDMVRRHDIDRPLSTTTTKSAVERRGDANSAGKPRRPATATDPVRQVPVAACHARGSSHAPSPASSRPVQASGMDDRSPSSQRDGFDCSCAASRSPDSERRLRRRRELAGGQRPQSSPSTPRQVCAAGGEVGLCSRGRVDSLGSSGVQGTAGRRAPVTRANTTAGGYLLQVPDVVYPHQRTAPAPENPTSDGESQPPLSASLPERWPSSPAAVTSARPVSPFPRARHAPRVYYSNSEDRVVAATDTETRAIVPSLPYSPCASPGGSPRLRRQPTRETRRLSVTETDEGWTQLNQYKLKDEIGKVRRKSSLSVVGRRETLR